MTSKFKSKGDMMETEKIKDRLKKATGPKTPHFFSLNQDIVARPQEAKVWIKVCNLQRELCKL